MVLVWSNSSETARPILMKLFCKFSKYENRSQSIFHPNTSARGVAKTEILRFTVNIFVSKWLLLVIWEIIDRN